jgi:transposase
MINAMVDAMHDDRTYRRVEVITGGRRRRVWAAEEKDRIISESLAPGVNISAVARRNGVSRGLLNIWRRQARELGHALGSARQPRATFAAVQIQGNRSDVAEASVAAPRTAPTGAIKIDIGGATIRVPNGVDRATLDAVISALRSAR